MIKENKRTKITTLSCFVSIIVNLIVVIQSVDELLGMNVSKFIYERFKMFLPGREPAMDGEANKPPDQSVTAVNW